MFVDEITLALRAGKGGDGVVRWRHEKGIALGGPAGGDGGKGGDVYAVGVHDIGLLARYRKHKDFAAEDGAPGARDSLHGKGGDDLYVEFPVGSIITNRVTGRVVSIDRAGEPVLLLKGGNGGYGNEHFKSSTNRSPRKVTLGYPGEAAEFDVELQLIADAGLIGFPNAGKSSLLNALTKASAKVGAYPFTTLEPNLGDFHGYILADIPGLIEGAGEGKGLGHKFLRHVRRTAALVHLVSLEEQDVAQAYASVRNELAAYEPALLEKPEIVVLTKSDLVDAEALARAVALMKKHTPQVYTLTLYDDASIQSFAQDLSRILGKLRANSAPVI